MKSSARGTGEPWWKSRKLKLVGYQGDKIVAQVYPDQWNSWDWRAWIAATGEISPASDTPRLAREFAERVLGSYVTWMLEKVEENDPS